MPDLMVTLTVDTSKLDKALVRAMKAVRRSGAGMVLDIGWGISAERVIRRILEIKKRRAWSAKMVARRERRRRRAPSKCRRRF